MNKRVCVPNTMHFNKNIWSDACGGGGVTRVCCRGYVLRACAQQTGAIVWFVKKPSY